MHVILQNRRTSPFYYIGLFVLQYNNFLQMVGKFMTATLYITMGMLVITWTLTKHVNKSFVDKVIVLMNTCKILYQRTNHTSALYSNCLACSAHRLKCDIASLWPPVHAAQPLEGTRCIVVFTMRVSVVWAWAYCFRLPMSGTVVFRSANVQCSGIPQCKIVLPQATLHTWAAMRLQCRILIREHCTCPSVWRNKQINLMFDRVCGTSCSW